MKSFTRKERALKQEMRWLVLAPLAVLCAACNAPNIAPDWMPTDFGSNVSCAEQSTQAKPPKNALVELAWCIAHSDDLTNADHLFHQTLEIASFSRSEGIRWGVQAGVRTDREPNSRLPAGIVGFLYQRVDPTSVYPRGRRYLDFGINRKVSCVTREDVFATFGRDFSRPPEPPVAPAPLQAGASPPTPAPKQHDIYAAEFRSPRLFSGDPNGSVTFRFDYKECAEHVAIQWNPALTRVRATSKD